MNTKYYMFTVRTRAFTEQEETELSALARLHVRQRFMLTCVKEGLKALRGEESNLEGELCSQVS